MKEENKITRGYIKLSDAAKAFHFDFRGKVVLDIGSSTGGFTKYALDHGAKKVIAVEKGTNQMETPLRFDPRVDLHEKTDIFDVKLVAKITKTAQSENDDRATSTLKKTASDYAILVIPDIVLADVSFISLKDILRHAKRNLSDSHTEFLVMLKPQFEAKPSQLNRGVVKNEKIRRDIIKNFEQWLKNNSFIIINKRDNQLHGKSGNQERFYLLKQSN